MFPDVYVSISVDGLCQELIGVPQESYAIEPMYSSFEQVFLRDALGIVIDSCGKENERKSSSCLFFLLDYGFLVRLMQELIENILLFFNLKNF